MSGIERRIQILREATRLFSQSGYDKVTIKELASACEITEPALYRHFESKEAIYDTVLCGIEDRLTNHAFLDQLRGEDSLQDLLARLAGHIIEYFSVNEDVYRLLLFSALSGHSRAKQVFELIRGNYTRFLAEQFDRLYRAGAIRKVNNEITARCFTGMVFDCAMYSSLWKPFQENPFSPGEVIANNVPIYVRGMRNPE